MDAQDVLDGLQGIAKTVLGVDGDSFDPHVNILEMGLDSLMIIKLAQEIERSYNVSLEATWFLSTMPTFQQLAAHVVGKLPEAPPCSLPTSSVQSVKVQNVVLQGGRPIAESTAHTGGSPRMQAQRASVQTEQHFLATSSDSARQPKQPGQALESLFHMQLQSLETLFNQQLQAFSGLADTTALRQAPAQACHIQEAPAQLSLAQSVPITHSVPSDTFGTPAPRQKPKGNVRGFVFEETPLTASQKLYVESLVARHVARTSTSKALSRSSPQLADWKSSLFYRPELKDSFYPIVADTMEGASFTDVDGNTYIDIALGMGVHYLGHNPPYVTHALQKRLERGYGLGPQCDITAEVASNICQLAHVERVCFCNTGTEAVMVALRLARARRRKDTIVLFNGSYHGIYDGILAHSEEQNGEYETHSTSLGVPDSMVHNTVSLVYNSPSALAYIEAHADEIAGVLVEPVQSRLISLQPQNFLKKLRRITRQHGICLIFDEMLNGFRIAPGGAQEYFGVQADMVLYGKVVGGGLPVGVISGKKDYLDYIDAGFLGENATLSMDDTIVFGGTFCRNPLSMEAARAATHALLAEGPGLQQRVSAKADGLANRLNLWFQENGVPMRLMNFGPQLLFESFGKYASFANPVELQLFFLELMGQGIYTWERRTCYLSCVHTDEDIASVEEAVKASVLALRAHGFAFHQESPSQNFFSPMTPTQERLYAIFQREHGQDAYHLPLAWHLTPQPGKTLELDAEALEIALGQCILRHKALRTSFHHIGAQLLQKVIAEPPFSLEHTVNTEHTPYQTLMEAFLRPYDLERAPLMRAALIDQTDGSFLFFLDVLHIVADGASLDILLDDLNVLMQGHQPLVQPVLPRADVLAAEEEAKKKKEHDTAYWVHRLQDADDEHDASLKHLDFPLDFPALSGSAEGHQHWCLLDETITRQAKEACKSLRVTLNMFLNGVYALFLHKLTGRKRLLVGMADGGRNSPGMEHALGMFVNTVVQDFRVDPDETLRTFFAGIRLACVDSMEHRFAPYGDIVNELGFSPAQTMLSYEKADARTLNWGKSVSTSLPVDGTGAMYDFAIDIVEMHETLHCHILSSVALRRETAVALGECFAQLVQTMTETANADLPVGQLSMLPQHHKEYITRTWADTETPYDVTVSFFHFFAQQVAQYPTKTALVSEGKSLTYQELDTRSTHLARYLVSIGVQKEDLVCVLLGRSVDFPVAVLAIWKAGAAYTPLSAETPTDRLLFQLADSKAPVLISSLEYKRCVEGYTGHFVDMDRFSFSEQADVSLPRLTTDMLVYCIYTSGTTGNPKGVLVEHRSLMNLCLWFIHYVDLTAEDRTTAFAPFVFDASVWELFPMLMTGATVHILSDTVRHTMPLIQDYLADNRISIAYFLSQVAELVDTEALPSLRHLLSGGDVLHQARSTAFCTHHNTYGPTECTVTGTAIALDATEPVSIGKGIHNTHAMVLDSSLRIQPIGVPGELFLSGVQVARSYLNRPDLTSSMFIDNPYSAGRKDYARMYRTGDICRVLPNGTLDFMGRLDSQVKIRGHRIELGEIEKAFFAHPAVHQGVVLVAERGQEKQLLAFVVAERPVAEAELRKHLEQHIPAYMHPQHIVSVDTIPTTPGGKIDKKTLLALPLAPFDRGDALFCAPQTEEERVLVAVLEEQLKKAPISTHQNFFELNGDSIKALMITSLVRSRGYSLDAQDFYTAGTIAELAQRLVPKCKKTSGQTLVAQTGVTSKHTVFDAESEELDTEKNVLESPVPDRDRAALHRRFGENVEAIAPLSFLQEGMVFAKIRDPESMAYVEQTLLQLDAPEALDFKAMEARLQALVARHSMLRTVFVTNGVSRPWQVTLRQASQTPAPFFAVLPEGENMQAHMEQERAIGFQLEELPLFRVRVQRITPTSCLFLLTVHHTIMDGWSMGLFFTELFAPALPGASVLPFYHYTNWLFEQDNSGSLEFWKEYLRGATRTELPPRVEWQAKSASPVRMERFLVPDAVTENLKKVSRDYKVSLASLLQGLWGMVLAKISGETDIVFGTVNSGRALTLEGVEHCLGLFSNTLPFRLQYNPSQSLGDYVQGVQRDFLAVQKNALCSLSQIQHAVSTEGNSARDLLSHFFVMENFPAPSWQGLRVKEVSVFSQTDFDFALTFEQHESFSYLLISNPARLSTCQIQAWGRAIGVLLEAVAENPGKKLGEYSLVSQNDQLRHIQTLNPVEQVFPEGLILDFFARQVLAHPHDRAVVFHDHTLTYAELDARSWSLASRIRAAGIGKEDIVAIILPRSHFFAVALFACLKAGAAFLPVAPETPQDRIHFYLQDSGAKACIGEKAFLQTLDIAGVLFAVEDEALWNTWEEKTIEKAPLSASLVPIDSHDLAYVIYTSGTTGVPKGVMLEHGGMVNQILWTARAYGLDATSRLTHYANHAFDVSVWELFPVLAAGGELHFLDETTRLDMEAFTQYLHEHRITDTWLPPHLADLFLKSYTGIPSLRSLTAGGDVFKPVYRDDLTLFNNYGPTEVSITATSYKVLPEHPHCIGRPVDNTWAYVLDNEGHLLPSGIAGELCLSGVQVGRGYLDREDLTREKFVLNPFSHNEQTKRMYRTGDICAFLPDGTLCFSGRMDHQVKLRGQRLELGEIEAHITAYPGVEQCVVLLQEEANTSLCAYVLLEKFNPPASASEKTAEQALNAKHAFDSAGLLSYLASQIPGYMVPSHVLVMDAFPLNQSGKIDKKAFPLPNLADSCDSDAASQPVNREEQALVQAVQHILQPRKGGAGKEPADCDSLAHLDMRKDFFQLGGDSISAIMLLSRLRETGFAATIQHIFESPSLYALAQTLRVLSPSEPSSALAQGATVAPEDSLCSANVTRAVSVPAAVLEEVRRVYAGHTVEGVFPLSPTQEGMYALGMEWEERRQGNIPYLIDNWAEIAGALNVEAIKQRFRALSTQHASLRTHFLQVEGRPYQVVLEKAELPFTFVDCAGRAELSPSSDDSLAACFRAASVPDPNFSLAHSPLLSLQLFRIEEDRYRLLLRWHHSILDGWSLKHVIDGILGKATPGKNIPQFSDYVAALSDASVVSREETMAWWQKAFSGYEATMYLPSNRIAEEAVYKELSHTFSLDSFSAEKLSTLVLQEGITLSAFLQAAWALLLARYGDTHDVCFGFVDSGRAFPLAGIENVVGPCVQTLPLRVRVAEEESFATLVCAMRSKQREALAYPLLNPAELKKLAGESLNQLFIFENQPTVDFGDLGDFSLVPLDGAGYNGSDFAVEWVAQGSTLTCTFHYNPSRFALWQVEAIQEHYTILIEEALTHYTSPMKVFQMLSPAELKRIRSFCCPPETVFAPQAASVLDLFAVAVAAQPEKVALVDGHRSLSYKELDRQSTLLSCQILDRCLCQRTSVSPAEHVESLPVVVALHFTRTVEFVVACLAVLKAGAIFMPLDPAQPAHRKAALLEDAQASLVLCGENTLEVFSVPSCIPDPDYMSTARTAPAIRGEQPAYLLYTSGSTGKPKGVVVGHAGLVNLCQWQHREFPITEADSCLCYAPFTFDASVYEIFPALTAGARLVRCPEDTRTELADLHALFQRESISVAFLPPQVGKQLIEWDLPFLKVLTLAGDTAGTLKAMPFKLLNCYGPTEFTVCATAFAVEKDELVTPIGKPVANSHAFLVDSKNRLQPVGIEGELCLSGVQLAHGYWHNAELTAQAFVPNPLASGNTAKEPYTRMYKTGDICRLLPDGTILFVGRKDEQVKIRGQRVELGEIEHVCHTHPAVDQIALLVEDGILHGFVVPHAPRLQDDAVLTDDILTFLASRLPASMVPQRLFVLEHIPLTPQGKLDKKALRLVTKTQEQKEKTLTEKGRTLATAWEQVLGVNASAAEDFFQAGGDSIKAMLLTTALRKQGWQLTSRQIFESPVLWQMAEHLIPLVQKEKVLSHEAVKGTVQGAEAADKACIEARYGALLEEYYPLTPMQEGILYQCALEPETPLYIEQSRMNLLGDFSLPDFLFRLGLLFIRHPVLRTGLYQSHVSQPYQVVLRKVKPLVGYVDISHLDEAAQDDFLDAALAEVRTQGFHLETPPLIAFKLCKCAEKKLVLLVSFHHSILDGWSMGLLAQELFAPSSQGSELLAESRPFRPYVESVLAKDRDASIAFFADYLAGCEAPPLRLFQTPEKSDLRDGLTQISFSLSPTLSRSMESVAAQHRVSVNSFLQSAWSLVLGAATGTDDVVFGAVFSGRQAPVPHIAETLGLFVNTLPVRVQLASSMNFLELVKKTQQNALTLEEHGYLALTDIREVSQTGSWLVEHLFVFENLPSVAPAESGAGTLVVESSDRQGFNQSHFPLALVLAKEANLTGKLHYNAASLSPFMAQALVTTLLFILEQVSEKPDVRLKDIVLCTPEDRQRLALWNKTEQPRAKPGHIVAAFRQSAAAFPRRVAVQAGEERLRYAELDARSDALASLLVRQGVQPGDFVAVLMERTTAYVVALLAVHKAGAAFISLDRCHPEKRLSLILENATPHLLLTQQTVLDALSTDFVQHMRKTMGVVDVSAALADLTEQQETSQTKRGTKKSSQPQSVECSLATSSPLSQLGIQSSTLPDINPQSLAYLVYTSGTTGKPKGVMVSHASLYNFCMWLKESYAINQEDIAGHVFSFAFDASLWGIFPILAAGAGSVILTDAERESPASIRAAFDTHGVSLANIPTAFCAEFLNLPAPARLRILTTGGDTLQIRPPVSAEPDSACPSSAPYALYNEYGPSEGTIMATFHKVDIGENPIPIGKPIANAKCHIVDADRRLLPPGFPGHLCLSGELLASGYYRQDVLTQAAFVPLPADCVFETSAKAIQKASVAHRPGLPDAAGGARMYTTGDICRWLPSGELEFAGRMDDQVSVRGFRVECGEIAHVLRLHPHVKQALVLPFEHAGETCLSAFLVVDAPDMQQENAFRTFAQGRLPSAMIPSFFVFLKAMPLSVSGKIDRKVLEDLCRIALMHDAGLTAQAEQAKPADPWEDRVATVFGEILALPAGRIRRTEDFFHIGGNSLKALRLCAALEKAFGSPYPLVELMRGSSVEAVAARLATMLRAQKERGVEESPHLVKVREGADVPFVFVHGIAGALFLYKDVMDALHSHSVYVLPLDEDGLEAATNLHDAMQPYAQALYKAFPDGNFVLVGHCMAGLSAWEIAAQLLKKGCSVRQIITMNTRSYLLMDDEGRAIAHADIPDEIPQEALDSGLETFARYEEGKDTASEQEQGQQDATQLRRILEKQLRLWACFEPPSLPLSMICLRSREAVDGAYLPFETFPLGWQTFAQKRHRELFVPGNHFTMLHGSYAPALAQTLRAWCTPAPADALPLTTIQEWFFQLPCDHNHFFQSVILRIRDRHEPALYQAILRVLGAKHPLLGLRFENTEEGMKAVPGGHAAQDRQGKDAEQSGTFVWHTCPCDKLEETLEQIAVSVDITRGALAHAVFVPGDRDSESAGRYDRLALLVHHLVVDGVSWRILQQDFHQLLVLAESAGERAPQALNQEMHTAVHQANEALEEYKSWLSAQEAWALSSELQSEVPYWQNVCALFEHPAGSVHGEDVVPAPQVGVAAPESQASLSRMRVKSRLSTEACVLDKDHTQALFGSCYVNYKSPLKILLLAALGHAMRDVLGKTRSTVVLEGHGKESIPVGEGEYRTVDTVVGWFTSLYPFVVTSGETIEDTLFAVKHDMETLPHNGIGYSLLRYKTETKALLYKNVDVLFNYLGDSGDYEDGLHPVVLERAGSACDVGPSFPQEASFAITCLVQNGKLHSAIDWCGDEWNHATAHRLLTSLHAQLIALVDRCKA